VTSYHQLKAIESGNYRQLMLLEAQFIDYYGAQQTSYTRHGRFALQKVSVLREKYTQKAGGDALRCDAKRKRSRRELISMIQSAVSAQNTLQVSFARFGSRTGDVMARGKISFSRRENFFISISRFSRG
jgi:hypothetical protein